MRALGFVFGLFGLFVTRRGLIELINRIYKHYINYAIALTL